MFIPTKCVKCVDWVKSKYVPAEVAGYRIINIDMIYFKRVARR